PSEERATAQGRIAGPVDPNLKVISRSITNLMLVGVLLSLVGGLVLLARPLAGEPLKLDLVSAWSSAFCLLGIFILCLRYGVILDRQQRTSTRWRGLLVPFLKGGEQRYSKAGYVSISSLRTLDPSKVTPLDRAFGTLVPFSDGCAVWLEEPGGAA